MQIKLVFLSFLFVSISFSQSESDSLVAKLTTEKNDSIRCQILNNLCLALCYNFPDSALNYGKSALQTALRNKLTRSASIAYNRIGVVYDVTNKWDTALFCYQQSANYAMACTDTVVLASAYNNMGLVYWNKTIYDKAVEYYLLSLELFEKVNRPQGVANTYNNLGLIYWEQQDIKKALFYQLKGLEIREEMQDIYGISASYVNLGMLYHEIDSLKLTKYYLNKSVRLKEELEYDQHGLAIAYNNLGITLMDLGQLDSAIYYYSKGIELHRTNGNKSGVASAQINLAAAYSRQKNLTRAIEILNEAKHLASSINNTRLISTICKGLGDEYSKQGDYQLATANYKQHILLNDSIFTAENYEKLIEIQSKYDLQKKDNEIAELQIATTELALKKAESELQVANRNKLIYAFATGLFILVIIGLFIYYRLKQNAEREKAELIIREKENSLAAVFEATENERQRIAKDLHDGVGQQLSGIKLAWNKLGNQLNNTETAIKLNNLTQVLDEATGELRQISHQMMPKVLLELGLIPAIEDMLEKSLGLSEIDYKLEEFQLNERLEQRIEIALFRVSQELINNIIKHSKAKKVNVQLYKNQGHVIMMIEDDGIGLNQNNSSDGHGFINIKSRLDVVHGSFNLEPSFNQGTLATVRIKL